MLIRARVVGMIGLSVALSMAVVGCGQGGPPMGKVSGTITLDGEPLANADVEFTPQFDGASPSYGDTDANGQYDLVFSRSRKGAWVGKHTVRIMPSLTDANGDDIEPTYKLPARYNAKSELTAEVPKGGGTIDFDLTSN
jgi:hypothetical protein